MRICCRAPLKFLLCFQLHLLVHFWNFYSLSSRKILYFFFHFAIFIFIPSQSHSLSLLSPMLSSSFYRRASSSSAWLCLTLPLARECCRKRKRDSKSQMSLGQWPTDSQRDVAPLPPCTRGINRRQSTDSFGQTFSEVVRQEKGLQCYSTDIGQAAGEMVKTPLP